MSKETKIKTLRQLKEKDKVWIVTSPVSTGHGDGIYIFPRILVTRVNGISKYTPEGIKIISVDTPEKENFKFSLDMAPDPQDLDNKTSYSIHQRFTEYDDDVYSGEDEYMVVISMFTSRKEAMKTFIDYYDEIRDASKKKIKKNKEEIRRIKAQMASYTDLMNKACAELKKKEKS